MCYLISQPCRTFILFASMFLGTTTTRADYIADFIARIPNTAASLTSTVSAKIEAVQNKVTELETKLSRGKKQHHSFEDSFAVFDSLRLELVQALHEVHALELLHTKALIRQQAGKENLRLRSKISKLFDGNKTLYQSLLKIKSTIENSQKKKPTPEQSHYMKLCLDNFQRNGVGLKSSDFVEFSRLKNLVSKLGNEFDTNVQNSSEKRPFSKQELDGLSESFLAKLEHNQLGYYLVGTDYPTYFRVMRNVKNPHTRRVMFQSFKNRAYPQNYKVLVELVNARTKLANLLGYQDYAHYDLSDQMSQTPENVHNFLSSIAERFEAKRLQEEKLLISNLPGHIKPLSDGSLHPADILFAVEHYKAKKFNLDQDKVAEYFPMEQTLQGLLGIYSKVFGITFQEHASAGLIHDSTRALGVYKNGVLLGHVILDLYPREGKYGHARVLSLRPSRGNPANTDYTPGAIFVIANLAKPTPEKPALFTHEEVVTFFHEFGHGLHGVFARSKQSFLFSSEMAMTYGLPVVTDFVELPSRLFELWLSDMKILKNLSGHYKTAEKLPDATLRTIDQLRTFGMGGFYNRQVRLSRFALKLYEAGEINLEFIQNLYDRVFARSSEVSPVRMPANFLHLNSYGAKYYSYSWADIFAADVFDQFGNDTLSPQVGKSLMEQILEKGGSKDPNNLLEAFLGRKPNPEAFFKDMGI